MEDGGDERDTDMDGDDGGMSEGEDGGRGEPQGHASKAAKLKADWLRATELHVVEPRAATLRAAKR